MSSAFPSLNHGCRKVNSAKLATMKTPLSDHSHKNHTGPAAAPQPLSRKKSGVADAGIH